MLLIVLPSEIRAGKYSSLVAISYKEWAELWLNTSAYSQKKEKIDEKSKIRMASENDYSVRLGLSKVTMGKIGGDAIWTHVLKL